MRLRVLAEPAQESVGILSALGRDLVVVAFQEPVHQYRQLVDRQDYRFLARSKRREQCVALSAPPSRVDSCPKLDSELADPQFVDSIHGRGRRPPGPVLEAGPETPNVSGPSGNLHHGVRRIGTILQIDKHRLEVASFLEAPEQFAHQAGFSHPPLCGHERMRAVLYPLHECLDFDLPVEEAVSRDPVSSCFS